MKEKKTKRSRWDFMTVCPRHCQVLTKVWPRIDSWFQLHQLLRRGRMVQHLQTWHPDNVCYVLLLLQSLRPICMKPPF
jgi:hypothetical protein